MRLHGLSLPVLAAAVKQTALYFTRRPVTLVSRPRASAYPPISFSTARVLIASPAKARDGLGCGDLGWRVGPPVFACHAFHGETRGG